jgi:hypothetical protein
VRRPVSVHNPKTTKGQDWLFRRTIQAATPQRWSTSLGGPGGVRRRGAVRAFASEHLPRWADGRPVAPAVRRLRGSRYATPETAPRVLLVLLLSRGRSSMVEPQPSKLVMRVRFPSPAPLKSPGQKPTRSRLGRSGDVPAKPRAINVPLPRRDEHAALPIISAALTPTLGLDMSIDRARDRLVSAPRLVLVNHRRTLAVVTQASHQVLDASPAGRCKRVPGVTQVVEMHVPPVRPPRPHTSSHLPG